MLQLELHDPNAVLLEFKPDTEKRAGALEPVTYLKISTNVDADALAFFEPTLKAFYFDEHGLRDLALGLPLRDPHAVFPHKRDEEMGGATVKLSVGIGAPMVFADAALDDFTLSPMDGGRVILVFRVKCRPDEAQVGRLYMLQKQAVDITIEPMPLAEMKDAA